MGRHDVGAIRPACRRTATAGQPEQRRHSGLPFRESCHCKPRVHLDTRGHSDPASLGCEVLSLERGIDAGTVVAWGCVAARTRHLRDQGIESSATIPLKTESEKTSGILFLNYRRRRDFPERDRAAISAFAQVAAIAIRNARLHAEVSQQAKELTYLSNSAVQIAAPAQHSFPIQH